MIIQACHSSDNNIPSNLHSSVGIFEGHIGIYIPNPSRIATHWGFRTYVFMGVRYKEFGAEQKTNIFVETESIYD